MPFRLRAAPVAALVAGAALVASSAPAAARGPTPPPAPPTAPVPVTVAVPVTCTFDPASPASPAMTATVTVTAPASVRANQTFAVQHRVHLPVMDDVPIALIGFGFRSTLTISGSVGPGGPRVLTQLPVDVPLGGSVTPETFSVPVTAGPTGPVSVRFDQVEYFFQISGPPEITATCRPDAGPVPVTTTAVVAPGQCDPSLPWWRRPLRCWRP